MAWTSPSTLVAGTQILASWANSDVRDNTLFLRSSPVNRCIAYYNSDATDTTNSSNALALNNEEIDNASMHDNSSNNSRITIPSGGAGYYIIRGQSRVVTNSGSSMVRLWIRKNGGSAIRAVEFANAVKPCIAQVQAVGVLLAAADYVELWSTSDSNGSNRYGSTTTFEDQTRLEVLGPLPPS